jgi:PHD/YefM family antitoxin component YafN of YafNO toxin-antitoxin module
MANVITIKKPMVLIPVDEYEQLLREVGEKPTPKLSAEIKKAREEFRKRKTIKWKPLKNELKISG